jgi:hypothetical protein
MPQIKNYVKNIVNENMIPAYQLERGHWFTDQDKKRIYQAQEVSSHIIRGYSDQGILVLKPDEMVYVVSRQLEMF